MAENTAEEGEKLQSALLDAVSEPSPFAPADAGTPLRAPPLVSSNQKIPVPALSLQARRAAWKTTVSGGGGPPGRAITLNQQGPNETSGAAGGTGRVGPGGNNEGAAANGQQPVGDGEGGVTLGQLKLAVKGAQKEKQTVYDFPTLHTHPPHLDPPADEPMGTSSRPFPSATTSVDSDTLINELDEFYSYVEVSGVLEGRDAWAESRQAPSPEQHSPDESTHPPIGCKTWPDWCAEKGKLPRTTAWTDADVRLKQSYLLHVLDRLEDKDPEVRFDSARRILYVAQGTFAHSTSREHHLHLVMQNARLLREVGGLEAVFGALKGVGGRHDWLSSLPEAPDGSVPLHADGPVLTAQERHDFLEEINGELAIHLAVLYFMVEVFRGEDAWGEELMSLDPPLPIYMFGLVAGLREKNAKGYPVKKLLLLLWKSLLATMGGMRDIQRVKRFVREIEGLATDRGDKKSSFKISPLDFHNFRQEISAKYPTYIPPDIPDLYLDRIAAAAPPQPVRPPAIYNAAGNIPHDPSANINKQPNGSNLQPGTPAPTPPQSPQQKPKKQQFQTDQSRPFVLPFSAANAKINSGGVLSLVPRSIDEAADLYRSHLRISTELWQTWKVREEFIADETGLAKLEAEARAKEREREKDADGASVNGLDKRMSKLSIGNGAFPDDEEEESVPDSLSMLFQLEDQLTREWRASEAQGRGKEAKRKAQRVQDTKRLQRVELLYRTILPHMQSAVIVLLKLLLATVTANTNIPVAGDGEQEPRPGLSLEDTDIMRHREITSKAVSAILVLTLKWFRASHTMKFHYLAQLLVDSNCLLLILKMFGLQEVATQVKTKNENEEHNFFRYCAMHGADHQQESRPEDQLLEALPASGRSAKSGSNDEEEVELITDYSWRNFFAVINFVHILQKLTKRRVHRILLLVQYKSSAILKRILKANHPTLQLYVLKVLKSQIPFCGRKWRQANMKVITAIYLNCRADLRDEWLLGVDVDHDVEDSLPQEQALRSLVSFYNTKHYSAFAPHLHRRPSTFGAMADGPAAPSGGPGAWSSDRPSSGSHPPPSDDVFPPLRSHDDRDRNYLDATMESMLDDSELESLFYPQYSVNPDGGLERNDTATSAWHRLGEILGEWDDISDSESVASIGYLGGAGSDAGSDTSDVSSLDEFQDPEQQRADWEHISPETIAALEEDRKTAETLGSPLQSPRRRNSSGSRSPALRPVLTDGGEVMDEDAVVDDFPASRSPARSPNLAPRSPSSPSFHGPQPGEEVERHGGRIVDEVELVWGT